jgi:hypothetical protein
MNLEKILDTQLADQHEAGVDRQRSALDLTGRRT